MTTTTKRRAGAPSKLGATVQHDADGNPVTAADAMIERLARGAYREEAARSIGVSNKTLYNWLFQGARARQRHLAGSRLTAEQRHYVEFLHAVEQAEAEAMLHDWSLLSLLADGGMPQVTTVERIKVALDDNGVEQVVERSSETRTSHTLPDASVLMWRLERRYPKHFGRRPDEELHQRQDTDAVVDDTRQRASSLSGEVKAYLAGIADAGVERGSPESSG